MLRVGDGALCPSAAAACSRAAPVFVDEVDSSSGALLSSTPVSGVALSSTDINLGVLTRCADGTCVVFAATAAAAGAQPSASEPYFAADRVIVRVGADKSVDTSTRVPYAAYPGIITGICSVDGSGFWLAGNASAPGLGYVAAGSSNVTGVMSARMGQMGYYHGYITHCAVQASPAPAQMLLMVTEGDVFYSLVSPPTQNLTAPGQLRTNLVAYNHVATGTGKQLLLAPQSGVVWAGILPNLACFDTRGIALPGTAWQNGFAGYQANIGPSGFCSSLYDNSGSGDFMGLAVSVGESQLFWVSRRGVFASTTPIYAASDGSALANGKATLRSLAAGSFYEYRGIAAAPFTIEAAQTSAAAATSSASATASGSATASSLPSASAQPTQTAIQTASATISVVSTASTSMTATSSATSLPSASSSPSAHASLSATASTFLCAAGYFLSGSSTCMPCCPGTYSLGGAIACALCPAGTYGSSAGLTTAACSGACENCPAGTAYPLSISTVSADARAVPASLGLKLWPATHPLNPLHVDLVVAPLALCQEMTSIAACEAAATFESADGILRFVVGTAAAFNMHATCAG